MDILNNFCQIMMSILGVSVNKYVAKTELATLFIISLVNGFASTKIVKINPASRKGSSPYVTLLIFPENSVILPNAIIDDNITR